MYLAAIIISYVRLPPLSPPRMSLDLTEHLKFGALWFIFKGVLVPNVPAHKCLFRPSIKKNTLTI